MTSWPEWDEPHSSFLEDPISSLRSVPDHHNEGHLGHQFPDASLALQRDKTDNQSTDALPSIQLETDPGPLKIKNRFSSGSVKTLRQWFADHEDHPYPTYDEIRDLQGQTGLTRQQVTNWFTNARRRTKIHVPRSSSPFIQSAEDGNSSGAQTPNDIIFRRSTPAPFEHMNPLQRWESSHTEFDVVSPRDVSSALAALPRGRPSRGRNSATSAGSRGSSVSSRDSGSCSSSYSNLSEKSSSFDISYSFRTRRRRNKAKRHLNARSSLLQSQDTYQCTFCTETFKSRYEWQRHEKSLHLSLESWQCSPEGPTSVHPEKGLLCVFCGHKDPDKTHLDGHDQSVCSERPLAERTFYRKDHLQQHLRLVHASLFMKWPMDQWKVTGQEIRSRCGFCNTTLRTWNDRVDHLAEHFKAGCTMEHWKGDWGFERSVLDRIDNAMPPYLIHYERNSPLPFAATKGPLETPASAYELVKLELEYWTQNYHHTEGIPPQDSELQIEGCSILLGAELLSSNPASSSPSWLRDLFLSSSDFANQARLRPTTKLTESRLSQLKINGKGNIFEHCELEVALQHYTQTLTSLGHVPSDLELQQEASNILQHVESSSPNPSRRFLEFLLRLVHGSTIWLMPLRLRVKPAHGSVGAADIALSNPSIGLANAAWTSPIDSSDILDKWTVPTELEPGFGPQIFAGIENDPWSPLMEGQSLHHTGPYQSLPRGQSLLQMPSSHQIGIGGQQSPGISLSSRNTAPTEMSNSTFLRGIGSLAITDSSIRSRDNIQTRAFFINDNNSYRRLKRELSRFVLATMSAKNPNSHIPSDEELKYQARWILYDTDDPWNQTPVDNDEWLTEFKRDIGLSNDKSINFQ